MAKPRTRVRKEVVCRDSKREGEDQMSRCWIDSRVLETPFGAGIKQWCEGWPALQHEHGQWLESLQDSDVLYALPPDFIEFMAKSQKHLRCEKHSHKISFRTQPALLSTEEAAAERSLYDLCEHHHCDCVGIAYGVPILYPLITQALAFPELSVDDINNLKWTGDIEPEKQSRLVNNTFEYFEKRVPEIQFHLTAYAGWLICNEAFRRERDGLRAKWEALPDDVRTGGPFCLPAKRLNYLTEEQRAPYADLGDGFLAELEAFLAKWYLMEMTTWDLPRPQGPLCGMSAKTVEHFTGRTPDIDYYPPFFRVPSSQNLHKDLSDAQQRAARDSGIIDDFPLSGLSPRRSTEQGQELAEAGYATALRPYFAELAFRCRYGDRRGFKSRLDSYMVDKWKLDPRRIRQIRKFYAGALAEPH
jgi:hypothetical protein